VGEKEPYDLKPGPATNTTTALHHPSKCATYESTVRISVIRSGGGGEGRRQPPRKPILMVSLVFLELFQDLVENPAAADTKAMEFELNSHLVTVALEVDETATEKPKDQTQQQRTYSPTDTLALDESFLFSLDFSFLNGSFNWTERRLVCGEVTPPVGGNGGTDRGVDEKAPLLRPSPHCYLAYENVRVDALPRCVCNRSGTYGLLIPRLQHWEPGVPVRGASKVGNHADILVVMQIFGG